MLNPEIWTENSENSKEIGDVFRSCFRSRNCETVASHVRMSHGHDYLMSILNPLLMKIYNK